MATQVAQSVVLAGTTPVPITATASDTIPASFFGVNGIFMRVITSGTATNVTVVDPNVTAQGNPGTVTPIAAPATGVRMVLIPRTALNASSVATVNFSSITGVTYELYTA